ncbi:MAG: amidohydrolase family protein [Chloroflexi bacterium]|nr:amidohydrolase family protein [Chloroflexota bacterium]
MQADYRFQRTMPRMIVDVHTHCFPPAMIARREELARADAGFAELYGDARARMASAPELIASMDGAGVDRAVAVGFWWRDRGHAEEHAEYLLSAAAEAGGRLLPFVPIAFEDGGARARARDYAAAGARGLGEVRPGDGDEDEAAAWLAEVTDGLELPLLVHAAEPVGHAYGGKGGGFTPGGLWRLLEASRLRVIAGHWGGGFPFFALMPEVRDSLAEGRLAFDSAASALLYEPRVFAAVADLVGPELVMWGSDYPLRAQDRDLAEARAAVADPTLREALLGGNAARFLGLG